LFDPTFRERVRDANPIEQIINDDLVAARHCPLAGAGEELEGWHPAHGSTSGLSLKVNTAKQVYLCFNCGEAGDVFTWVMHVRGYTFVEALHSLAEHAGIPLPSLDPVQQQHWQQLQQERHDLEALFRVAADFFHEHMTHEHIDFCKEQWGLTLETIQRYKLGFAPVAPDALQQWLRWQHFADDAIQKSGLVIHAGGRWHDFFQGRIVFPYWRDFPDKGVGSPGTPLYFIGRRLDGTTPDKEWEKAKYRKQLVYGAKHPYVSRSRTRISTGNIRYAAPDRPCPEGRGGLPGCPNPSIPPLADAFPGVLPRLLQLARRAQRLIICNDNEDNQAGAKALWQQQRFSTKQALTAPVTSPAPAASARSTS
jgi:hypothetical protein